MGQLYGISREGIFPSCAQCGAAMRTGSAPPGKGLVVHNKDGICVTCDKRNERGWTYDYRLDLNRVIALQPGRTPIERDPNLYAAFAPDREQLQLYRHSVLNPVRPCIECGAMTRPKNYTREDYPGTVQRSRRDTCHACYIQQRQEMAS